MTRQGMAENGGFCRTMRRKMAENGGFCRTMWRILSQYGAVNVAYIDHSQSFVLLPGAGKQDIISNETLEILLIG